MGAGRVRRSELTTPGNSERMIEKASRSMADVVILDLEDSVPVADKVAARHTVIAALNALRWEGVTRAVRINGVHSGLAHQDVIEIVECAAPDVIVVPKVRSIRDVWFVDTLLDELETINGLTKRVALEVLIEDVEGLIHVEEIARCSSRVEALTFGPGDLAASQGAAPDAVATLEGYVHGEIWDYARTRIVVAARAAGIDAIDGPFSRYEDLVGLERECVRTAALGFAGKWVIHPAQIEVANVAYAPRKEDLESARRVVQAYEEAARSGMGAATIDGLMIDEATVRRSRNILEKDAGLRRHPPANANTT